jgi:hypothetical protein
MRRIEISFRFCWYDMWVGAYWDGKKHTLYVCLIPMIAMRIHVHSWCETKEVRVNGHWEEEYQCLWCLEKRWE